MKLPDSVQLVESCEPKVSILVQTKGRAEGQWKAELRKWTHAEQKKRAELWGFFWHSIEL